MCVICTLSTLLWLRGCCAHNCCICTRLPCHMGTVAAQFTSAAVGVKQLLYAPNWAQPGEASVHDHNYCCCCCYCCCYQAIFTAWASAWGSAVRKRAHPQPGTSTRLFVTSSCLSASSLFSMGEHLPASHLWQQSAAECSRGRGGSTTSSSSSCQDGIGASSTIHMEPNWCGINIAGLMQI